MEASAAHKIVDGFFVDRTRPQPAMTVEEACDLADYLNDTPDGVVPAHKLREAVRVLARAIKSKV